MCRMHHAFVCRDAVLAVLMAERGVTGPKRIFSGQGNFFRMYYPNFSDCARLTADLGTEWEFAAGTMIKPYMCCKCFHAPMYALQQLIQEHGLRPAAIDEIRVVTPPMGFFTEANYAPANMVDRQMSAPWCLATVAVDGELFLDAYEAPNRTDVTVLMNRVRFEIRDSQPTWAGEVRIKVEGSVLDKRVDYCLGHPQNPVDWQWLEDKLEACCRHAAEPFPRKRQGRLVRMVQSLETLGDCSELTQFLCPAEPSTMGVSE